jgi:S1-C subfamily serine protease
MLKFLLCLRLISTKNNFMRLLFSFAIVLFSALTFSQTSSTINISAKIGSLGSSAVVNVFLNEELAGKIGELEHLQCKLYSKGRITITITYPESYIRRATVVDVEKGKNYYFMINGSYTAYETSEENWNITSAAFRRVIKFEENDGNKIVTGGNPDDDGDGPKQGTGFLISKKGYVLTNYHVISNTKTIQVKGVGGDFSTLYGVDVVAVDVNNDLALLKFKNPNILFEEIPYSLSKSSSVQGSKAFVLGYPLANAMGEEIKLTDGLISAKSGFKGGLSNYQFSAPVQPGNSGSPLFNESGDVIGIASSKLRGAESAGYAIKSQYIHTFLNLVDNFSLPVLTNTVKPFALNDKVSKLKNFIYIIKTEGE